MAYGRTITRPDASYINSAQFCITFGGLHEAFQAEQQGDGPLIEAVMTAIREHDRVVLTADVPDERLAAGDVGTVVHIYRDGRAYEVEFVSLDGEPIAIVTLEHSKVRPVARREITHARSVA